MVDATDLKSVSHIESEGSSPSTPIFFNAYRCQELSPSLFPQRNKSAHSVPKITLKARSR